MGGCAQLFSTSATDEEPVIEAQQQIKHNVSGEFQSTLNIYSTCDSTEPRFTVALDFDFEFTNLVPDFGANVHRRFPSAIPEETFWQMPVS